MTSSALREAGPVFHLWELEEEPPVVRSNDGRIVAWADARVDSWSRPFLPNVGALVVVTLITSLGMVVAGWITIKAVAADWNDRFYTPESISLLVLFVAALLSWLAWRRWAVHDYWRSLWADEGFERCLVQVQFTGTPWAERDCASIRDGEGRQLARVRLEKVWRDSMKPAEWSLSGPMLAGLVLKARPGQQHRLSEGGSLELLEGEKLVATISRARLEILEDRVEDAPEHLLGLGLGILTIMEQRQAWSGDGPPLPI